MQLTYDSSSLNLTLDREADAAYLTIASEAEAKVSSTIPVTDTLLVDVNSDGGVIGIEILQIDSLFPAEKLANLFPDDAETLTSAAYEANAYIRSLNELIVTA